MSYHARGLTASNAIEHARYTVFGAGAEFPAHISPIGLVNEAGEWLVSAHQWAWTTSRIMTLGTTAGQDRVPLPDDYGGDLAEQQSNSLVARLRLTDVATIIDMKAHDPATSQLITYAAVNYWIPPEGGEPVPQLLLHPTPTVTTEDAFTLVYTARWQYLHDPSDLLVMPGYCVTLFLEVLVAIARGRMEEDQGSVATRLQGLMMSDLMSAAKHADRRTQSDMGRMRHTHTSLGIPPVLTTFPYNWTYANGPS